MLWRNLLLVRRAPARVADHLRERAVAPGAPGALRLSRAPLLVEHDDLVVQGDIALGPAQHLDRRGELAPRLARQRFHPAQDLDAFLRDPEAALPPLRHARAPPASATFCTARANCHGWLSGSVRKPARRHGVWTCEGRPGRGAWPPFGRRSGGERRAVRKGVVRSGVRLLAAAHRVA